MLELATQHRLDVLRLFVAAWKRNGCLVRMFRRNVAEHYRLHSWLVTSCLVMRFAGQQSDAE